MPPASRHGRSPPHRGPKFSLPFFLLTLVTGAQLFSPAREFTSRKRHALHCGQATLQIAAVSPCAASHDPQSSWCNTFSLAAACVFAGTIAFIRLWQRLDPLEAWTKGHPRFDPDAHFRKARETAGPPWLGADASSLNWLPRLGHQPNIVPQLPMAWWAEEADSAAFDPPQLALPLSKAQAWAEAPLQATHEIQAEEELLKAHEVAASLSFTQSMTAPQKLYPVTKDDLVIAIPTHQATEPQVRSGRSARLGIRTVIVTNYTESATEHYPRAPNEVWTSYPDANPKRSFYPGDDRAALAPFIAFRELGDSFKWLFYGDDDTVFFGESAIQLASTMDPELPYFVTDNLWWSGLFGGAWHPHPQAPRCLPCGFRGNATAAVGMKMVAGCPCTPALICALQDGYNGSFAHGACGAPRAPARSYSMHGGAGALISIGLLRQIDWESMERCVNHQWSSGGDAFITICLWEQGFAHTTPDPTWHPRGLQMFDPSPQGLNPDDFITWKASHVLGNILQKAAGVCKDLCKLEFENTVTVHLRARRTGGSDEGAAAFVRAFSRLYSRVTGGFTAGSEAGLADVTGDYTAALAAKIDAEQDAAVEAVRKLLTVHEATSTNVEDASSLDLRLAIGVLTASDAVRSGIADAVASQLLSNMLKLVAPLTASQKERQPAQRVTALPGESLADFILEMNRKANVA